MIINCLPWKLDVDVEGTRQIYDKRCFTENEEDNQFLFNVLGHKEKKFFLDLGIDLYKIHVSKKTIEMTNDNGIRSKKTFITAEFFLKGLFVQIPAWQTEQFSNDDVSQKYSKYINVYEGKDDSRVFVLGKMSPGMIFKPLYSRVENYKLKSWKPGYISGNLILIQK